LPLHLENYLCAFASQWGFPQIHAFDGQRTTYSVLSFQYQSRLLRLTLAVLTELRRNAQNIYRDGGPFLTLRGMWLLPGVASRVGDGFVLPREADNTPCDDDSEPHHQYCEPDSVGSPRHDRHSLDVAAELVQMIFAVQLGAGLRLDKPLPAEEWTFLRQLRGCRPWVEITLDPNGRVCLGPAWSCDSLLQRMWLQAFSDLDQAAALTRCSCGCATLLWLKGKQLRDYCEGKKTWAPGHRARAVGRERRERLKAERPKEYPASERERVRARRAQLRKSR
jgi:hypothetical protein